MKSPRLAQIFLLVVLIGSLKLHAQSGCDDSPEAPTDVLMLVGSVGMVYGSSLLRRLINGRNRG
jgi:XrtJ-associated TM-motif-TM protein